MLKKKRHAIRMTMNIFGFMKLSRHCIYFAMNSNWFGDRLGCSKISDPPGTKISVIQEPLSHH